MSSEPQNPYAASTASSLPSLAGNTGTSSLAQSARLKQLKTARIIFFIIGVLMIIVQAVEYNMVERMIDTQIKQEVQQARAQGMVVDQAKVQEVKAETMNVVRIICFGLIGLGVVYVICGFVVNMFPIPVTIFGLVTYSIVAIVSTYFELTAGGRGPNMIGIGIKAAIIYGFFRAMQAAFAYERDRRNEGFSEFSSYGR